MKNTARVPSSETAKRVAAIFHRQTTSLWNEKKEIPVFRDLSKAKAFNDDDLALIERYYRANWPPRRGINALRTDLATLLNNWQGELDRARIYCEAHAPKPPRKIIPGPFSRPEPYVAPTDPDDLERIARFDAERLARKGRVL